MKKTFIKESLLAILVTLFSLASSFGQTTIKTNAVSGTPFCSGTSISVSFDVTGTFAAGNVFTAQLSNELGVFDTPIATATGTSPISLTIPVSAVTGNKYSVRVIASSPATTGNETGSFVINSTPPAPYSGVYAPDFCVGDAPRPLSVAGLPGATIRWYGLDGTELSGAPTPSTSAPRSAANPYVNYTQTLNGCESPKGTISVGVWEIAKTPAVINPTACQFSNATSEILSKAVTSTAPNGGGGTLSWYDALIGGNFYQGVPTPSTSTAGTQDFYVSQDYAMACPSPRVKVTLTVSQASTVPTYTNPTYTKGQTALALTATGTQVKWYETKASAAPLASAPIPPTASVGKISYWVTQNSNGCESERAEVVVTVTACAPPAKPVVSNKTYEVGENAPVLTATGTNLKWYADASSTTSLPSAPKPSTTNAGVTKYYVTQTNASDCESERAEITVTVTACTPPAKPVVSNKTYEVGDNAPVLTAAGISLKWYADASTTTPLPSAPKPSTIKAGVTKYYVTQTNAIGCESERAEILVTVSCKEFAGPTVVTPLAICQSPLAAAPLKATPLANHELLWYSAATGGTGSDNAPIPPTDEAKSYSYFVSQKNPISGCESARKEIVVNVREAAKPTVSPIEYCVGEPANVLSPSGNTYKWYAAESGGSSLPSTFKPSTTNDGTTPYFVSQSTTYNSLVCESVRVKVNVVVNATPAGVSALSEAFCQERTDKNYTFPTQASTGNTLNWYTTATGGTATTSTPTINLKNSGETTYYVTQLTNKGCESAARVIQKVRVKPLPGLPAIAQALIEYCQFVAAEPLKATPVANATLDWFGNNASGGTASPAAPTPSTAEGGTTSFYVAQTLEGCISDRAKIDVKINTTPKPTTKTYLEYCQNEVAPVLDATGTVLKWYRAANGTDWQGVPFVPFTEKVQDYSFFVTQTGSNGCESPKEEIKIHIKSLPSATISGNSTIDLGQSGTINIKFTGDGPWIYVLSNGLTDTTDQANHQVVVKPSTTTSYLVTEVSNACGKGLPIGSALVTVKVPTINSGSPSISEVCAGKTFSVPFQQSGDFPAGNTFKVQVSTQNTDSKFVTIPSVASASSVTATFPDTTKGGTYFVRVVSSGTNPDFTVKGSVSSITINASPLPVATLSGTQTILVGETADLKVDITGKSPWTFTLNNGTKDTLITANATPYGFKLSPKTTTTYAITKVTNACGIGSGVGTARVQVDPILGVEPPAPADWAKVYPTVIQDKSTVEITGTISPRKASVEVIDLNGRSRSVQAIKQPKTEVNFSTYPSGLYLLRIQNGNLTTVQRVMKP